ncbi:MAG TPA: protein kinase [Candidatus Paceibacterota bacterium]|nr:protein kinase [Candidatus Paceibacterota bacterium]
MAVVKKTDYYPNEIEDENLSQEEIDFIKTKGYEPIKRLGEGRTRSAVLAKKTSGEAGEIQTLVVLKPEKRNINGSVNAEINVAKGYLNRHEADIAHEVQSPYIARTVDTFRLPDGKRINTEEYHEETDLETIVNSVGPLQGERAKKFATQLFEAISVLHSRGYVHRDISPANVLILPDGGIGSNP